MPVKEDTLEAAGIPTEGLLDGTGDTARTDTPNARRPLAEHPGGDFE
jgi:hypothetical protein